MKIYRAGWHFKFPSWCDQCSITRRSCPVSRVKNRRCISRNVAGNWFVEETSREQFARSRRKLGRRLPPPCWWIWRRRSEETLLLTDLKKRASVKGQEELGHRYYPQSLIGPLCIIFRCASISCTDGRNRLTDSLTHWSKLEIVNFVCLAVLVFYPVGMFVWSVWSTCSTCSVWSPGSHWSVWSPCSVWSPQSVWSLLLVWSSRSCSHPGQSDHNWHNLHFA